MGTYKSVPQSRRSGRLHETEAIVNTNFRDLALYFTNMLNSAYLKEL